MVTTENRSPFTTILIRNTKSKHQNGKQTKVTEKISNIILYTVTWVIQADEKQTWKHLGINELDRQMYTHKIEY